MTRVRIITIVAGVFVLAAVVFVLMRQPVFLFNLGSGESGFDEVYAQSVIEPDTLLFADEFRIKVSATFDAREFEEKSVIFVIPKEGLVVHKEELKKWTDGSVVTVEKTITAQCLSCLPRESSYGLGEHAVILRHRSGELKSFTAYSPQIRVASRLLPEDFDVFPLSLRPQEPVILLMRPGMALIPYLVFGGAVFSVLCVAVLAVAWLLPRRRATEASVVAKTPFQDELDAISRLLDGVAGGGISPDKAADECYRILRAFASGDTVLDDAARGLETRLLPVVFGPPEHVDRESVLEILSEARDLIMETARRKELSND